MKEENHYIYLLQTREFINCKDNVYKIGKTTQEHLKRFKSYPNGSKLLIQITCKNCHTMERKILDLFNAKYQSCKPEGIGNEYFRGSYVEMMDDIYRLIKEEGDLPSTPAEHVSSHHHFKHLRELAHKCTIM